MYHLILHITETRQNKRTLQLEMLKYHDIYCIFLHSVIVISVSAARYFELFSVNETGTGNLPTYRKNYSLEF